ncbi:hypothetical protein AWB71_02573 [Caballeronia peredens]|nr:hypothetical protein AWB71_02573 [Caballeronia peredens]
MRKLEDGEFEMIEACVGANIIIQQMKRDGLTSLDIAQARTRALLTGMDGAFRRIFTDQGRALMSGVLSKVLAESDVHSINNITYENGAIQINQ